MALPPFQRLLDAHAVEVHRFLVATVGPVDADDCYQETWIAALSAYPGLRDAGNLRGWIFTIAHRKALDLLRARSRRGRAQMDGDGAELAAALPAPAVGPGPTDRALWGAVAALPPKQRTAVALRFVVDADYAQVAAMMAISEAAARQNVAAALRTLRRELPADV